MSCHVIPLNDEQPHDRSDTCLCEPTVSWLDPETNLPYARGALVVHNAFDCREVSEWVTKEAIDESRKWAVYEVN